MGMAADAEQGEDYCTGFLACIFCLVFAGWFAGDVTLIVLASLSKDPVYSITITGAAGLDPILAANNGLLSPVFNLTVRIDNSRQRMDSEACVGGLSTVAVSYADAVLGRGSVPQFCAKAGKVQERGARVWTQGVSLPQFLLDQLAGELAAGEAAVDVKVTTPAEYYKDGDTVLVCSQAKIGGGPAPCRKQSVYRQQQADHG